MPVGPVLVLLIQGFIAMELAYYLGPRNFRSSSESYRNVMAVFLGIIVFAVTNLLSKTTWEITSAYLTEPSRITFAWFATTIGTAILVGICWHICFSRAFPLLNKLTHWARRRILGPCPQYHGPIRVFDRAMDLMDGLEVEVFLKDSRVIAGTIKSYPTLDGDSGIVIEIYRLGTVLAPRRHDELPRVPVVLLIGQPQEPKVSPREHRSSWDVEWLIPAPDGYESLLWIPQSMVEGIRATRPRAPE